MARLVFLLVLIALPAFILADEPGTDAHEGHLTNEDVDQCAAAYKELISNHGDCPAGQIHEAGEGGTVQCGLIPKIPSAICMGVKALCKTVKMIGC